MKKFALLFVAAALISGGAFAQDKACAKKSASCHSPCCKDKKSCKKGATTSASASTAKKDAAKKS